MSGQLPALARLYQTLGDATRLRILGLLLTGEVCVCHIHESLRISQPKASRHLAYLRRAGLVEARRDGLWVYYRLSESSEPIVGTIRQAAIHVLAHLAPVREDARRLAKRTGCCLPAPQAPGFACCDVPERSESAAAAVRASGRPTARARAGRAQAE
jgi:ArsR family transcriptional regulator